MILVSASVSSPANAARSAGLANRTSASSPNVASGLLARAAPLMSAPGSRASRAAGERGRRDHVRRRGSPHDPLGHVALAALLDQLHQTVLLKGLDVVVDLLPGQPEPRREGGRGIWLGQLREHPGPDRIERDLRGCGVLDHCDVVHARTLSPTIILVKTARTVLKNFLSGTCRGHARSSRGGTGRRRGAFLPAGAGSPCQPVVTQTTPLAAPASRTPSRPRTTAGAAAKAPSKSASLPRSR